MKFSGLVNARKDKNTTKFFDATMGYPSNKSFKIHKFLTPAARKMKFSEQVIKKA